MSDSLNRLVDRAALQDLMTRYARGVDRRDWEAVRATFHPDAHDDHGEYKGGVDGFIAWVSRRHEKITQSMHFLGNCLIEFQGPDVALVETYYVSRQTIGADAMAAKSMLASKAGGEAGPVDAEIWGRYIDIAERRQGEWRTAYRTVAFEVLSARPSAGIPIKAEWAQARRDASDPLNALRARAISMSRKNS